LQGILKFLLLSMDFNQTIIQSVSIIIVMILMGMGFRRVGVLKEEDSGVLARLITQYTLPALIFHALSTVEFEPEKLLLAVVMIVSQLTCALLAWGLSSILKLSRPKKGALILASTFTSSGFLGYAVVKEIYFDNTEALSDAAITSELGVATVFFTIGVLIAIQFGVRSTSSKEKFAEAIKFFRSPIFFSLVLGILFSFIKLPMDNVIVKSIYRFLGIISTANTLLVTLTIGVLMHFKDMRKVIVIVLLACVIKLIVQPLLSHFQAGFLNFPDLWHNIIVLESAMPTAALTAVFAKRYGCDAELTTILIFATFISSIFTMIMMILLLN